jgi:hypothetical protein
MSFTSETTESLLDRGVSRRHLGRIATVLTAGAALPFYNEFAMAQQAEQRTLRGTRSRNDPDAARIPSNENPLGPCKEGLEALIKVAPHGGRYQPFGEQAEFVKGKRSSSVVYGQPGPQRYG